MSFTIPPIMRQMNRCVNNRLLHFGFASREVLLHFIFNFSFNIYT